MNDDDGFVRRLRALYCRHRAMTYAEFDRLVVAREITFAELLELVDVLSTEIQNVGIVEYLFPPDREAKRELETVESEIAKILKVSFSPQLKERYRERLSDLQKRAAELRRRLS